MATSNYYYEVGDVIRDMLILERVRLKKGNQSKEKGYRYKCLKDGYIGEKSEVQIRKGGNCPVCTGSIAKRGYNDIATTHPHLVDYFVNKEEAYLNRYGSGKKVNLKCPICGTEKTMEINTLSHYGFSCPICSDGISYPEKFVASFLRQSNIDYITQYSPKWAENKKYDFYLPNENIIIETNGKQHYEEYTSFKKTRALDYEQNNDLLKEILAKGNLNCKYFTLDCRESNIECIKNSIINSDLLRTLKVLEKDINWQECGNKALSSKVKDVIDLWNTGKYTSTKEIGDIVGLNLNTVNRYLKLGNEVNACTYTPTKGKKKIFVIENNKIYESAHDLERKSEEDFGIKLIFSSICRVCRGERKSYKGLHMKYIEE